MRATLPEGPEFAVHGRAPRSSSRSSRRTTRPSTACRRCCTRSTSRRSSRATSPTTSCVTSREVIGCTTAEVEDVVSYYVMFHRNPVGKYVLQVCTTLSCALAGAERVIEELQHKLGIKVGETDPTGMFTIQQMECLGACDRAPVMMVNNDHWHEQLEAGAGERPRRSDRRPTASRRSTAATSCRAAHRARARQDDDAGEGEGDAGLRAGADEVRVHARRRRARSLRARTSTATRA